ncbi:MAG: hypothetical protein EA353_05635 [Puniceicoccaceae bacterium]|nr:MAG: hypothetical protein EA353_05635 [Puniceicoccaceae bacterium]
MSQAIEEYKRRKQADKLFPTVRPMADFMASGNSSHGIIEAIIESFCDHWAPDGAILGVFNSKQQGTHLNTDALAILGVSLKSAAELPDVIIHDTRRNRLLLIEAATSGGPIDETRRKELKELFDECTADLIFITVFESRCSMQRLTSEIAWASEVWIAEDPGHLIHFSGEAFLKPYKP